MPFTQKVKIVQEGSKRGERRGKEWTGVVGQQIDNAIDERFYESRQETGASRHAILRLATSRRNPDAVSDLGAV